MANVKKRFVVDLTLNTKDAEKQLKATAGNIKTILADMGKASDKMGYFKELVDYIKQIDTAMTALKNKDPMKFNELFDGLDGNLKQSLESLFGVANQDMSVLDELRNKLKSLDSSKVGVGELRNIAQEINDLFDILGQTRPLNIEEHFKGAGNSVERIQKLTDAVDNFATIWSEVNQKVQQGFGGSGLGSGSNGGAGSGIGDGIGETSEKIQQQIDIIKKQIEIYKNLKEQFIDLAYAKEEIDLTTELPDEFRADHTVESIQQLIDTYQKAAKAKKEFEAAGDTSSVEYYENLGQMSKIALQLNDIDAALTADLEDDMNAIKRGRGTLLGVYEKIIEEANRFLDRELEEVVNRTPDRIDAIISSKEMELKSLGDRLAVAAKSSGSGSGTGSGTGDGDGTGTGGSGSGSGTSTSVTVDGPIDVDFSSLESTIKTEMASIKAKLDDVLQVELVKDDTKDISSAIESIKANVDQISSLVKSYQASKANSAHQTEVDNMKNNLAQLLQVVSDFNDRKIDGKYQRQEIGAAIMSDGSISAGYGEAGTVPWDRMANSLIGNLTKTLLVDVHSHPWAQFLNGKKYANDSFSGSSGDLGAFRRSKELGAQIAAMITGNVMRTLDLSKLTNSQMQDFRDALSYIEKQYANTPEYSKYMEYKNGQMYYHGQSNILEQHKVTEAFESLMYKAFEKIGFSKDKVDQEIFKKYDLTDDTQLTALAEVLVQLSHASQNALSPVGRLSQIVSQFGGDMKTEKAQAALKAYEKGERSAADVFNLLNNRGYTLSQDTIDSLMHIDTANDMPVVESLLTKISSVLDTINANIVNIEGNTRLKTDDKIDNTIDDLVNIKNGVDPSKFFTSNIKSIFDPSNISNFKNDEVIKLANEAVDNFAHSFNNLVNNSIDSVNISELERVLNEFKLAMTYVQDASKQIDLYQNRTNKMVMDGSDIAEDTLFARRTELIDEDVINTLITYLRQAKSTPDFTENTDSTFNDVAISKLSKNIDLLTQISQKSANLTIDALTKDQGTIVDLYNSSEDYANTLYELAKNASNYFNDQLKNISTKFFDSGSIEVSDAYELFDAYQNAAVRLRDAKKQVVYFESDNNTSLFDRDTGESAWDVLQNISSTLFDKSSSISNDILTLLKHTQDDLLKNSQMPDDDDHIPHLVSALVTLTSAIEMLTTQLKVDNGSMPIQNTQSHPTTSISIDGTDLTSEISQCEALLDVIDRIRWAVEWKTDAFEKENNTVQTVIPLEIDALRELEQYLDVLRQSIESLFNNISVSSSMFTSWKDDLIAAEGHVQNILDLLQQINAITEMSTIQVVQVADDNVAQPERGYALESTLQTTNSILGQILTAIGNNESVAQLVEPLKSAVTELKTVADNIIQTQNTQKTKLLSANDRIANDYEGLSDRAKNAVAHLGTDIQIKQLSALENGIVKVEGAAKDADGVWKGFTVEIDSANNTIIKAINEQSKFANSLNKSAEEAKKLKETFNKNLTIQTDTFEDYKKDLEASGNLTDELRVKLDALEIQLKQIGDNTGLEIWQNQFENFQKAVAKSIETLAAKNIGTANKLKKDLNLDIGKLDFKIDDDGLTVEQEGIKAAYQAINDEIEEYIENIKAGNNVEITGIQEKVNLLKEQTKLYKEQHKIINAQGGKVKAHGAKDVSKATTNFNSLKNKIDTDFADNNSLNTQLTVLKKAYDDLISKQGEFKAGQILSPQQEQEFNDALKKYQDLEKQLVRLVNTHTKFKDAAKISGVSDGFVDSKSGREVELQKQVQDFADGLGKVTIGNFTDDYNSLLFTIQRGNGVVEKMKASFDELKQSIIITSRTAGESTSFLSKAWNDLKSKTWSLFKYYASSMSIQEIIQIGRQGLTYVKEIDTALTELKKVTDETDASYNRFLQDMSKAGAIIGATVTDLTTMAAEWSRLGYSMKEAGELAQSTAILLNVSEFSDATAASEALISTMQAFQYTADESQHVVDILNEVGNNYAVSSDGIATALQDSASALMAAGNNLEQSVALVAAANKVVQDPNSVGSALRTISLRLRGTSVEVLEEMGEETDGAVESISKLQSKIKALSGVNILTNSGEYKDTYTILYEIGQVWEDMADVDQAALLELMAGKNRANTLSAILSNMKDLKGAYEDALNAEGSALRENEAYLNSIQGRIDLFTNALQTMWMNLINTDFVKGIVDIGTFLIKTIDSVYGKVMLLISGFMAYGKIVHKLTFSEMFTGTVESLAQIVQWTNAVTGATLTETLARKLGNDEKVKDILTSAKLLGVTGQLTKEQIKLAAATLTTSYKHKDLSISQYLASMSSMGLKTALQGLWNVLMRNPLFIVAGALTAAAMALDKFVISAQEAADAAQDAFDKIDNVVESTKSTIQSLESELETLQNRIDELDGKKLSFAEDQELEKLKKQREELEHSLKVQEQLLEMQKKASAEQAVDSMKKYTKAASEGAEETKETAKSWGKVIGGIVTAAGIAASVIIPGDFGTIGAAASAAGSKIATWGGLAAIAGGVHTGGKVGEYLGSKASENNGSYEAWYETYTKALETARNEEQKALKAYQADSSNIDKLDKWQEAQQKVSDIETEMYNHLSQMQQYMNNLEYGVSEDIDEELDTWYNFLDKFSIQEGASGAEKTALDRIFGENASDEIKDIKDQILDAITAGQQFNFNSAINSSQELKSILDYVGLSIEDVKNYFTQVGETIINPEFDISKYQNDIKSIQENIAAYQEALESLESGTFTMSDFIELIEKFPDLAKGVDTSSKSFNGLTRNLKKAIKASPDSLIDDLKELRTQLLNAGKSTVAIDQLITSMENMPTDLVSDLSDRYGTLADEITRAKQKQEELAKAMEENPNAGYETRGEAYESMREMMGRGEIGSESNLWNIAEEAGFKSKSTNINEMADELAEWLDIRERWYTEDDDGNYTFHGTERYIEDVEKAVQANKELQELMVWEYDSNTGEYKFDFRNKDIEQIVALLGDTTELAGLTNEEFHDMLIQIGQYFGIDFSDVQDDIDELIQKKQELLSNKHETTGQQSYKQESDNLGVFLEDPTKANPITLTEEEISEQTGKTGEELVKFVQKVKEQYGEAVNIVKDPLNIYTSIQTDGADILTEISELQGLVDKNGEQVEIIDEEKFRNTLTEIGYAPEIIDAIIGKTKELNKELPDAAAVAQEVTEQYNNLIAQLSKDEGDSFAKFSEDDINALKEYTTVITDRNGVQWFDQQKLWAWAKDAGVDLNELTAILELYGDTVKSVQSTDTDPLGLQTLSVNASETYDYIQALGVEVREFDGKMTIDVPSFVDYMTKQGWNSEQITDYMDSLHLSDHFTFTDTNSLGEAVELDINTDKGHQRISELVTKATELSTPQNTVYTITGTGVTNVSKIANYWADIVKSKTTDYTINETTNKRVNWSFGFGGSGSDELNGTAHANGTAYKGGSWGAPRTETALTGELGPELRVRGNRWDLLGENGAEFADIQKGDIIFNHKQTEQLLSNGYVTSRGKAYASGTAYASGGGKFTFYKFNGDDAYTKHGVSELPSSASDVADSMSDAADAANDFEETLDWVEIRLEEINEQLDFLNAKLENAVGHVAQNNIIDQMLDVNSSKLKNLQGGLQEYTNYAAKLLQKIPAQYRAAAQDGAIAITEFAGEADEKTVEAINNYREWAQKAADLKQQIEELTTEIADLAKQKFDNVATEFENIISLTEAANDKLDAQISLMEDRGYVAAKAYYESMAENTKDISAELVKERNILQSVIDEQVKLGNIKVGDERWYEMVQQLYDVDAAIVECTSDLESFQNAINDIYWDNFDELISRYGYLSDETQNLIDLMDEADMVTKPDNEDGWSAKEVAWTDEGIASLGLYAQQMEIAEYQSKQYAKAIEDLSKDYKDGKYSESEYLEKLNELKNDQYDAIEAYYDAQEAIKDLNSEMVDMVKEGLEKQIEAYEKLAEKRKEALDAEKDAYDWQKSVSQQQKSISDIDRQIAALSNDNSITATAKRKQLEAERAEAQAELDEMYYERSIENQKEAIDTEVETFTKAKEEEIKKWEEYLDNVELVVADSLGIVQANASGVYDTLSSKANEYNLTLSNAITTPWQDGAYAVSDYQEVFDTAASSTTDQLEKIKLAWQDIIDVMAEAADVEIAAQEKANNRYVTPTKTTNTTKNTNQQAKSVGVGSTINAKGAKIYAASDGSGVGNQYYSSDPVYVVIGENNGYWKVRHRSLSSGVTGWFKKSDVKAYAKGTLGAPEDQLAWIDELGEEMQLVPDGNGRLAYIKKGTGILTADLTERLIDLAMNPQEVLDRSRPQIGLHPEVHNTEINITMEIADVVRIDTVTNDTIPNLTKAINKELDKYMKQLNGQIRRFAK